MEKERAERFWERIDRILIDEGRTLEWLARETGILYSRFMSQRLRVCIPKIDDLIMISDVLDISIDSLVGTALKIQPSTRALRIARELDRRGPAIMESIENLLGLYEQPDEKKNIG